MTYAAYLRIYEPVSAFHEPDRSRWAAYAASAGRPRRLDSLSAEHSEALHRAITVPQIAVPEQESEHAYIRRAEGITYVCPWQTRLRCLQVYRRMLSGGPSWRNGPSGPPTRLHILGSVWTVPLAWFVLFTASEKWLALGPRQRWAPTEAASATASATRALIYTTAMSRARRRVARGLATLRGVPASRGTAAWESVRMEAELAEVGRWLEEFHPYSLVELDYGGLVHLVSDDGLRGDQSVAEVGAALDGLAKGERELAVAMYERARNRWRAFAEFEQAN
jgi:hypothetical protein